MLEIRNHRAVGALAVVVVAMAGCAVPEKSDEPVSPDTTCVPATQADPLVGNWLSTHRQAGVAGELKTFIQLRADGTMNYAEQLTRPGKAPQGLTESGCWRREQGTLVLRTLESNGSPVDLEDPIYVNRYAVLKESGERVSLNSPEGQRLDARRMPRDYRISW